MREDGHRHEVRWYINIFDEYFQFRLTVISLSLCPTANPPVTKNLSMVSCKSIGDNKRERGRSGMSGRDNEGRWRLLISEASRR